MQRKFYQMNKETIENVNTQNTDVGFRSIHLEAAHNITIKRGLSVKCNATFSVNNDTLHCVKQRQHNFGSSASIS